MAAQHTYDFFNYLFRGAALPLIQQHLLGRHLLTSSEWSNSSRLTLLELDDYCLAYIFQYLPLRDLVRVRRTCRRLHHSVSEFLDTRKHLDYTCDLNGMHLQNGHYHFNWTAFDFVLRQMPNLRSVAFERCRTMTHTLATCSHDILDLLTVHLYDLKMLHLGRSLAITPQTVARFRVSFPDLTHLSINLFSESLLANIVDGFRQLKYLNLDQSIVYNYAATLTRLPPTIRTLILPQDLKNEKLSIVEALARGNGTKLDRLEMKVCIHDLVTDAEFFNQIGQKLKQLKWLQCELSCSNKETTQNSAHLDDHTWRGTNSLELNERSMSRSCSGHYEHRHVNLVRGLNSLQELRVLILKERDYFDTHDRCTILDDRSMLDIFQSCPRLEMLTISCALRRNQPNYHADEFESRDNVRQVNRLLNQLARKSTQSEPPKSAPSRAVRIGKRPAFDRSESLLGDLFEGASEEQNLMENVDGTCPHIISDGCLAHLDQHLPRLHILQLRGIRLGLRSMEAIVNLKQLQCLRLDSISFNANDSDASNHFNEFITKMATANMKSKTNIRITNIPLL